MEGNQNTSLILAQMAEQLKHIADKVDTLERNDAVILKKIEEMRDEQGKRDTRLALLEERVSGILKIVWALGSVVGLGVLGAIMKLVILQ